MNHEGAQHWVDRYVKAWRNPETGLLSSLFSEDVVYSLSPWRRPLQGISELSSFWEQRPSGPNEVFIFESEIVAMEANTVVVRVDVTYPNDNPRQWKDIWIIKFRTGGLCYKFEEWPFSPKQDDGQNL